MNRPSLAVYLATKNAAKTVVEKIPPLKTVIEKLSTPKKPQPVVIEQPDEALRYQIESAKTVQEKRRKLNKSKNKSAWDTATEMAFHEYAPIVDDWIKRGIIFDSTLYTLVAMWSADAEEFPFLIRMVDNAVKNNISALDKDYIKQSIEDFTLSSLMRYIKEHHLEEPESRFDAKIIAKPFPKFFFEVFAKVDSGAWTINRFNQMDLYNIAGDNALNDGDKMTAVELWRKSGNLSEQSGRKVALKHLEIELGLNKE